MEFGTQTIYSKPEYTIVSQTDETIFVTDETGAPHVFTREEWDSMNGGLIGGGAFVVALILGGLAWWLF